jgi:hypothetical protein
MRSKEQTATNAMSEYLFKLQLIISNTEFMNKEEARNYETMETKVNGMKYVNAVLEKDAFESYDWSREYLKRALTELGYSVNDIIKYLDNIEYIPIPAKDLLLKKARKRFISMYKEPNKYYLNLMGQPLEGTDPIIETPDEFVKIYEKDALMYFGEPIHLIPKKYQELFINSDYYQDLLKKYPKVEYLKHIGSYSIPLEISRPAKDGDILLINTAKLSAHHEKFGNVTVTADIVHEFTNTYTKVERYIYGTLRGDFSQIYPNYNSFIRLLTIYMTLGQCMNSFMKKSNKLIYMNDTIADDYFTLYGLPNVVMEGRSLTQFLKKFRQLLMDKGTNTVYRVKDLIGYENTDIFTLVMVKQQAYKNGYPMYYKDPDTGEMLPKQNIVFRRLGTCEDNVSYFQFKQQNESYDWYEIASGDPRWWDTPEVRKMIQEMNYTLSNSKYIQLSTIMDMDDIWWQCCILLRGLLDFRRETKYTNLSLSQSLGGKSMVSLFESVLLLIIMMNWNHTDYYGRHFNGDLYLPNGEINGVSACLDLLFNGLSRDGSPNPLVLGGPYKLSQFNFDIRSESPEKYHTLSTYEYLEPEVFMPMLDNILDRTDANIGEVIMGPLKSLFKYLETKLRTTTTIHEFRQVTDAYNWLFLVDPVRDWSDTTTYDVDQLISEAYGLTREQYNAFKMFFTGDDEIAVDAYGYHIPIYQVLNNPVLSLSDYPFQDQEFVKAFNYSIAHWKNDTLENSEIFNDMIRIHYRDIIQDKVMLDLSSTQYGPKSFEALLYREDPELFRALQDMKGDGDQLLILMRSIIRSLEDFTNSNLSALEFQSVGEKQYIAILKEVITYFKSYMVEFTKEEFRYLFAGLFDYGGNSNMLRFLDEINHVTVQMIPRDALHLYDVSCAKARMMIHDDIKKMLHDEAVFRMKMTYSNLVTYKPDAEFWYIVDDRLVLEKPDDITNNTKVVIQYSHHQPIYTNGKEMVIVEKA